MIRIGNTFLKPLKDENLLILYEWRNDPEFYQHFRQFRMITWEEHARWFRELDVGADLMYGIYSKDRLSGLVGCAGLCNLNWHNRSAELSMYVSDRSATTVKYSDVLAILEYILFRELSFNKLWAEVYTTNMKMCNFLKKYDFQDDGIIRDSAIINGNYVDGIILSKLNDEYLSKNYLNKIEDGELCLT